MRVILIDDEQLALDVLEIQLQKFVDIEVVKTFTDPSQAMTELKHLSVNVVFLDIEMPGYFGLQLAEDLLRENDRLEIVFITAYHQYAIEAFELNAIDYLLKPVNYQRLQVSIKRLRKRVKVISNQTMDSTREDLPKEHNINGFVGFYAQCMAKFQLFTPGKQSIKWRTKKVRELFLYLGQNYPNPVSRMTIIDDLWPDYEKEKAITLLHTTIYQLRKLIRSYNCNDPLTIINESYVFKYQLASDIRELQELFLLDDVDNQLVKRALDLYQGDYLEHEGHRWSYQFQDKIRREMIRYLEKFVLLYRTYENPPTLMEDCLEKMLQIDPYNEQFMCMLIDYYRKNRQVKQMVDKYRAFHKRVNDELGVDLHQSTIDFFNKCIINL